MHCIVARYVWCGCRRWSLRDVQRCALCGSALERRAGVSTGPGRFVDASRWSLRVEKRYPQVELAGLDRDGH